MTTQQSEIKKSWRIFTVSNSSILELRAIRPSETPLQPSNRSLSFTFKASDFSDIDACKQALEEKAIELNDLGYNIYIVMNQIRSDFCDRSVKDKDINARQLLLIDIDRCGDTKNPASDIEVEAAESLGSEVQSYLKKHGLPEPERVMSGNGAHLYYKLNFLPNNEQASKLIKDFLNHLASNFNSSTVTIDTTVTNASRITKMPGTIARKGIESEGRPYRMAKVYD